MIVTLRLTNGTMQSVDVATIEAKLGSSSIEVSFGGEPAGLQVYAPGNDEQWHSFAVLPRAANSVTIVPEAHEDDGRGAAR